LTLIGAPFAIKAIEYLDRTRLQPSSGMLTTMLILMLLFNSGAASLMSGNQIGLYNVEEVTYNDEDIEAAHFLLSKTNSIDRVLGGRRVPLKFNSMYFKYSPDPDRLSLIGHTIKLHQLNANQRTISSHYCELGSENFIMFYSSNTNNQTMQLIPGPRGGGKIQGTSTANPWKTGILNRENTNRIYDNAANSVLKTRC
jgi:hypothetical protein